MPANYRFVKGHVHEQWHDWLKMIISDAEQLKKSLSVLHNNILRDQAADTWIDYLDLPPGKDRLLIRLLSDSVRYSNPVRVEFVRDGGYSREQLEQVLASLQGADGKDVAGVSLDKIPVADAAVMSFPLTEKLRELPWKFTGRLAELDRGLLRFGFVAELAHPDRADAEVYRMELALGPRGALMVLSGKGLRHIDDPGYWSMETLDPFSGRGTRRVTSGPPGKMQIVSTTPLSPSQAARSGGKVLRRDPKELAATKAAARTAQAAAPEVSAVLPNQPAAVEPPGGWFWIRVALVGSVVVIGLLIAFFALRSRA